MPADDVVQNQVFLLLKCNFSGSEPVIFWSEYAEWFQKWVREPKLAHIWVLFSLKKNRSRSSVGLHLRLLRTSSITAKEYKRALEMLVLKQPDSGTFPNKSLVK